MYNKTTEDYKFSCSERAQEAVSRIVSTPAWTFMILYKSEKTYICYRKKKTWKILQNCLGHFHVTDTQCPIATIAFAVILSVTLPVSWSGCNLLRLSSCALFLNIFTIESLAIANGNFLATFTIRRTSFTLPKRWLSLLKRWRADLAPREEAIYAQGRHRLILKNLESVQSPIYTQRAIHADCFSMIGAGKGDPDQV